MTAVDSSSRMAHLAEGHPATTFTPRIARLGRGLGGVGLTLLAALALVALAAPVLAPYDPGVPVALPFAPPSAAHPLGTDDIGQDVLSQVIVGARVSLALGAVAAVAATVVGTATGITAGALGGMVDAMLMRLVDVMLTLPMLPLAIVVSAFVGPSRGTLVVLIAAFLWARTARVLRAQALTTREREFIMASRALGARDTRVVFRHILPAAAPLIVPELVRATNAAIVLESSLSFLGLGDPTTKSWGSILFYANARSAFLTDAWIWWVLPPGMGITLTVLAFALVGLALEERLQPVTRLNR